MFTPLVVKIALNRRDSSILRICNQEILEVLKYDVKAIEGYRAASDRVCVETLKSWFPNVENIESTFKWLDETRDFIYTKYGLVLLTTQYLYPKEPLQYAMLRISKRFSDGNFELWRIMYDLLSCGMIHVSSIFAAAEKSCNSTNSGEECRIFVGEDICCHNMIPETEKIRALLRLGVDVGYGASNIPKYSPGRMYYNFNEFVKTLNACNNVTSNGKKSNIALYVPIHNDTIFDAIGIKVPSEDTTDNVFVGLMVPDYFIKCVYEDKPWYLFAATTKINCKTLADYTGDEYVRMYHKLVDAKLYSEKHMARSVMCTIIQSMILNNGPYIIWSDNVNRYNNQNHLGIIKTLDSFAQTTNFSDSTNSSSCTQMSCNMAMYKDFPDVLERVYKFMLYKCIVYYKCQDFELPSLARYAYMIGYMSTLALNKFMGNNQRRREIGLSPFGVYDMALLANEDNIKVCRVISEALYKGAIQSSCDHYSGYGVSCKNYDGSEFSKGRPQWALRGNLPTSDWSLLVEHMQNGMANSMLTSQAPTSTACVLTGVTESVTLPIMDEFLSKKITECHNKWISYGIMYRSMNMPNLMTIPDNVDSQLAMYTASLDFIDHSQSTMFTMNRDIREILSLLFKTHIAKLKTAIFCILSKD